MQSARSTVWPFISKNISAEISAEVFVEFFNRRKRLHRIAGVALFGDEIFFFNVMLIIDLANNLFQYIFDSYEPRYTAVFVDDDGHMIAIGTEFFE